MKLLKRNTIGLRENWNNRFERFLFRVHQLRRKWRSLRFGFTCKDSGLEMGTVVVIQKMV